MSARRTPASAPALLLLLAACGGPTPPWQTPPSIALDLQAATAAKSVPLFAEFELRLDLFRRQDLAVDFAPAVPEGFAGSVQLDPERPLGDGVWQHATLRLRPTSAPGQHKIAPFTARAKDGTVAASTPELELEVTTLLAGADPALEAPGPPFPPRAAWWPWAAAVAGVALLLGAVVVLRRRARRPRLLPAAVAVPAHVKALRELQRLRSAPRATLAEIDAFYVATSHVLRVYLEERFGLRAPERTTEEFLQEVEAGGPLSLLQCRELRRFLDQCDLVKFAAQEPPEPVHQATLAAAEALVEGTRPDRAPLPDRAPVEASA